MVNAEIVSLESVERLILIVRGQKVLLDRDLADLYGVAVKVLKQAVRRNRDRFPPDFAFALSWNEARTLESRSRPPATVTSAGSRSQTVTLNVELSESPGLSAVEVPGKRGGNIKYRPLVFTEQGVAMLSSVLGSHRAVQVNIEIMRAFVRLRQMLQQHADLATKLAELESKYDGQFRIVFQAIHELMTPVAKAGDRIGFRPNDPDGSS